MTAAEHESDLKVTTDTPYLTRMGELLGVCCEEIGANWLHYNSTALYIVVELCNHKYINEASLSICARNQWRSNQMSHWYHFQGVMQVLRRAWAVQVLTASQSARKTRCWPHQVTHIRKRWTPRSSTRLQTTCVLTACCSTQMPCGRGVPRGSESEGDYG